MNNYRVNQEHEIRSDIDKIRQLQPLADRAEKNFSDAREITSQRESDLNDARADETRKMEVFRTIHSALSEIKSRLGENQEEFFQFGEEHNDWQH